MRRARRRFDPMDDHRHPSKWRSSNNGLSRHYSYKQRIADKKRLEQTIQSAVRRELLNDNFLQRVTSYAQQQQSGHPPPSPPPPPPPPPPQPLQSGGYKDRTHSGSATTNGGILKDHLVVHADLPSKFMHPCRIIVAGPSMSGKTTWVKNLLKKRNQSFSPQPKEILWFYNVEGSIESVKEELPGVQFFQGLPEPESIEEMDKTIPRIIIIDDQQTKVDASSDVIGRLFTVDSHHMNISIIFVVQNLFLNAKKMRSTVDNAQYIVYMKGGKGAHKISTVASQIWGWEGTTSFMNWVRNIAFATDKTDYPYLLFDMHNQTPAWAQLKTNVFPGECNTYFIKKGTVLDSSFEKLKRAEAGTGQWDKGSSGQNRAEDEKNTQGQEKDP